VIAVGLVPELNMGQLVKLLRMIYLVLAVSHTKIEGILRAAGDDP
jgi:hypothetical protein